MKREVKTIELSIKQNLQHQNPQFGHTQGEIKKNLQKSTLALRTEFHPVFPFS
jgi:hypothetical protein